MFTGLQQQNTALALENRRVKQDVDKLQTDKKTALEKVKTYESKIQSLEDDMKTALKDKEEMMEKMNKALARLELVGKKRDWSVTEYMVPSKSEIPVEVIQFYVVASCDLPCRAITHLFTNKTEKAFSK